MQDRVRAQRLFVGIALDATARAACAAVRESLRATGFAAKFEADEKLHVTLAFLGNVGPAQAGPVGDALAGAAASHAAFNVVFGKLGAFPHERRPRVVYVGARDQGAAFRALAAGVRGVYTELGFAFKDDAVAHITIARVKAPARPLPLLEFAPFLVEINALSLFESIFDPKRATSRYEIVKAASMSP